jgi:F-type H+-transporting ATPase subunit b
VRSRHRRPFARRGALLALVAVLLIVTAAAASARAGAVPGRSVVAPAVQEHGGEPLAPANAEEVSRPSVHGEPFWVVLARLVNFAILVGVLVYFLRAPIAQYLARRSTEIRSDLVKAADARAAAAVQLAAIEEKMKALPVEIEALRRRGAEEIAAEEARIREAAAADRARLLEQARREITLQLRAAERELIRCAADLTIGLASDRIKRTISEEDRLRLVERYLAHLPKQA